jgi:hypothetical protein
MADNLTDDIERLVLDWINGVEVEQPVAPLVVRLMGVVGSDSAEGTEVTGDSYAPVPTGFGPAATTGGISKLANTAATDAGVIDTTASTSVAGIEVWDSGIIPRRIGHHAFAAPVTVPANEPAVFDAGTLTLTLG